jgi:hypothetical protein
MKSLFLTELKKTLYQFQNTQILEDMVEVWGVKNPMVREA